MVMWCYGKMQSELDRQDIKQIKTMGQTLKNTHRSYLTWLCHKMKNEGLLLKISENRMFKKKKKKEIQAKENIREQNPKEQHHTGMQGQLFTEIMYSSLETRPSIQTFQNTSQTYLHVMLKCY